MATAARTMKTPAVLFNIRFIFGDMVAF